MGAHLVSVVIPCYNQARYLREAIDSALAQHDAPREIIVVDDGSTDDTPEVATRYPGVLTLRQRNRGLAAARNAGLTAAVGDYVVFLDADDRLLPGALEAGAAALGAHPYAAFAVGRARRIAEDGRPLPTPVRLRIDADHYVSLIRRCWIVMPATVTFRRLPLLATGGFDARVRYAEDYDVYLRLARNHPVVDHYVEVAEYRQHPGTQSRNNERMLINTLRVLAQHRPGAAASPRHHAAYRARENAVWYYDRLLEASLAAAREGRWAQALRGLFVFARELPRHPAYAVRRMGTPARLVSRALRRRCLAA
jgi:glycosyltransferase involved in cell wall biosynthesis